MRTVKAYPSSHDFIAYTPDMKYFTSHPELFSQATNKRIAKLNRLIFAGIIQAKTREAQHPHPHPDKS